MCWDVTEYLYVVASSTSLVVSSSHAARAAFEKFEEGISQSKRRMMRGIMGGREGQREGAVVTKVERRGVGGGGAICTHCQLQSPFLLGGAHSTQAQLYRET